MLKKFFLNYQKLQDLFFTKHLYYFSVWLKSDVIPERRVFLVETSWMSKKVSLDRLYKNNSPSFLFCEKGYCSEFFKKNPSIDSDHILWKKIFDHGEYEIFEKLESSTDGIKPLRLGISYEEQKKIMNVARRTLVTAVTGDVSVLDFKKLFSTTRLNELCDVDVVLWVDGELRGSQIVHRKPFKEAVVDAVRKSYNDERFPKITEDELSRVRIEIVFLHTLHLPLTYKEMHEDTIYYNKRYQSEVDYKTIQYIPAVFNCREFRSLFYFLEQLFLEKSRSILSTKKLKTVFISEVSSYIESEDHKSIYGCDGPIPQVVNGSTFQEKIDEYIKGNILYLRNNQDIHGNIIAIHNPVTGVFKHEDIVRLSFMTYALFYYNFIGNDIHSRMVAEKSFLYLKSRLYGQIYLSVSEDILSHIYFARAAKLCNEMYVFRKSMYHIERLFSSAPYDPILYSQYALILLDEGMKEKASELIITIFKDFTAKEKNKNEISLAEYAELPKLLLYVMGEHRDYCARESKRIVTWYLTQQNSDGSFYSSSTHKVPYTRGTAKVLEALVGLDNIDIEALYKTLVWCMNMQYTRESCYFIPKVNQDISLGGMRESYGGGDIWIDGVGHMLLVYAYYKNRIHT